MTDQRDRPLIERAGGDVHALQCPVITSTNSIMDLKPLNYRHAYRYPLQSHCSVLTIRHRRRPSNPYIKNDLTPTQSLLAMAVIFLCSLLAMGYIYSKFPELEEHEKQHMKIPLNIEDAKHLGLVLDRYKEKYFYEVLYGVFIVYIFLQTFAIPGSLFLSILAGFLFPFFMALSLVCLCSAMGASLCFLLSHLVGKKLIKAYFPERAKQWSVTVEKNKGHLFYYMVFLRVTPFLPNWFINLTAPLIGVPLIPFAFGTFVGVAPPSFVCIQAGQTLHTLTSSSDAWSWTSVAILTALACISLIPVILQNKMKAKFE